MQELEQLLTRSLSNFQIFHNIVFPLGLDETFKKGSHINEWCFMLQHHKNTCILAPRKHSKSTTIYSYIMWEILRHPDKDLEILYLSYTKDMAAYHLSNFKIMFKRNEFFKNIRDLSRGAESVCRYTWDNKHRIKIEPDGILSFKRGRHPHIVILDDILSDPTTMLDLGVIMKINNRVFEDVMSLPKEGGKLIVIGTPQTTEDFFYKLKELSHFAWSSCVAVISDKDQKVLWPEGFTYYRLMELKAELGEKAFMKEYQLTPVYAAEAFFQQKQVQSVINLNLNAVTFLKTENDVIAGWDIGKKTHPSHFVIFEIKDDAYIQRFQIFMDNVDYTVQVDKVNEYIERYGISRCYFDNTRGEMEGFMERGDLEKGVFIPINFNIKNKHTLAVEFEKAIVNKKIELLNDGRQTRQILNCTNDLKSVETVEGHGDSFWSIGLALGGSVIEKRMTVGMPLDLEKLDPDNLTGLQ